MSKYEDGNVGIGSTVPPDVARYQELAAAQAAGNVGVGSTVSPDAGNVGDEVAGGTVGNIGNIGNIGSIGAPGDGNVGIGTSA